MFVKIIGLSDPYPLILGHIFQINANWYLPNDIS